jgi:hypothetical protein
LEKASKRIEQLIRQFSEDFLRAEYGEEAAKKLEKYTIKTVNAYDAGVSEVSGKEIRIAAKRDIDACKLTNTTKLTIRHELGHILDEDSSDFPEFEELIEHEKIAWKNAKLKTPAEHWCKNLSIRTHMDPLKMHSIGYPNPETKVSPKQLKQATSVEVKRMQKDSKFVDRGLAERFAMANLVESHNFKHKYLT